MDNQTFEVIRQRRAIRHFSQQDIPQTILLELLELANRAPSGFNLQPWQFIIIRDAALRKLVCHVAMDQRQVIEAPVTVVFVADPDGWKKYYPKVLDASRRIGSMTEERIERYRRSVDLFFSTGPFGLFGCVKNLIVTMRRFRKPTPHVSTSRHDAGQYVCLQTMLAASTFMIAAKAVGLDTSPMEGFDEYRLKKLLSIPSSMRVPLIVALGYGIEVDEGVQSVRLPIEEKLSFDLFNKKNR